ANEMEQGMAVKKYQDLSLDPALPLFNRAVGGVYPPGSVFKIVPSIAALESKVITGETVYEDTGILRVNQFSFSNWYFSQYGKTEGFVDLRKGIARSNDIFFYRLGEATGDIGIAAWGKKLGLGEKSGIELTGEAEGIMPDRNWRKTVRNQEWYLGDTYHLAIGQGDLQVTPLQINRLTGVIAGGGVLCKPTLLKVAGLPVGAQGMSPDAGRCKDLGIKKETLKLITDGMERACSNDGGWGYQGTGWPLFDFTVMQEELGDAKGTGIRKRVPVACKTGTAEFGDPNGQTHAWFTAFAPIPESVAGGHGTGQAPNSENIPMIIGDPEIVVTVFVEKGGEGSSVAGPIAKKVLEEWFRR
ncbi:MAG: penicillin-binding transpeptidase domain-containing protein, partial [Patescibacteria group bacterium]